MELPNEIVLILSAGIGFVVTNGLKAAFPAASIGGTSAKITAALVTCVVALSEQLLGYVPQEFQQTVLTVFTLVVSILGAYGIHYTAKGTQ